VGTWIAVNVLVLCMDHLDLSIQLNQEGGAFTMRRLRGCPASRPRKVSKVILTMNQMGPYTCGSGSNSLSVPWTCVLDLAHIHPLACTQLPLERHSYKWGSATSTNMKDGAKNSWHWTPRWYSLSLFSVKRPRRLSLHFCSDMASLATTEGSLQVRHFALCIDLSLCGWLSASSFNARAAFLFAGDAVNGCLGSLCQSYQSFW
jgi:hypothetical protein